MVKVKSIEDWIENYVIGTIQGAFKTKRYWMRQGYDKNHSINNAVQYAVGQIEASVSASNLEHVIEIFREISTISNAFADMLEDSKPDIPKT